MKIFEQIQTKTASKKQPRNLAASGTIELCKHRERERAEQPVEGALKFRSLFLFLKLLDAKFELHTHFAEASRFLR